ncbi:TetR/AcrR family transcriptional regulator [Nocardia sp. NPDC057227]|uniref:TetR/AcrR family transcriptional regulator n=1 Tax=Nocardia sp. NPDC057227 TaxID=3346056 RepID=UPI00363B3F53
MAAGNRRSTRADDPPENRPVRRRPADRRAQIANVSAEAFGAHGYHGVSMEEIATRLDITSTALYRHYPSKYALFRQEALRLSGISAEAVRLPPESVEWDAEQRCAHVVEALLAVCITNRRRGALLRWQHRYLEEEDRRTLVAQMAATDAAIRERIAELRPGLPSAERAVLTAAVMSVIGSISDHRVAVPTRPLTALLAGACRDIAGCTLPAGTRAEERTPPPAAATFTHEVVLQKAVELFHVRGYPGVSVEDIAAAAGLPASSAVYRFYRSKGDLLAAAFRRAADRVSAVIGPAIAGTDGPGAALTRLIELYVDGSFAERELTFVYYAEIGNVPAADRTTLRNIQRLNVEEWAKLVTAVRSGLSAAQARVLVHAALALVVDLGQWMGPEHPECTRARVVHLMRVILLGSED